MHAAASYGARRACLGPLLVTLALWSSPARSQMATDRAEAAPFGPPVDDERVYVHGLLEQFEGRLGAPADSLRWEGEGWVGGDMNRLWLKSEGDLTRGRLQDGQQELLYDRPVTPYFDLQAGGRYDLDSGPGRGWAALGVEGFAPFYATVSATLYAGERGRYAAKLQASDEIRFTQRLILEPQAELNLYTRRDPARDVDQGLSDIDAGLRLRYEFTRKVAPYVGVAYRWSAMREPSLSHPGDGHLRATLGLRSWF
jgi:copper resistance protein B